VLCIRAIGSAYKHFERSFVRCFCTSPHDLAVHVLGNQSHPRPVAGLVLVEHIKKYLVLHNPVVFHQHLPLSGSVDSALAFSLSAQNSLDLLVLLSLLRGNIQVYTERLYDFRYVSLNSMNVHSCLIQLHEFAMQLRPPFEWSNVPDRRCSVRAFRLHVGKIHSINPGFRVCAICACQF
jgi:hypothetical protein